MIQRVWKRVSGVLCDRKINVKIKEKVYRTGVRLALVYVAETWALKEAQEKKTKVGEIINKVQESRLK